MKPSTAGWLFAAPALTVIGLFFGLPVIAALALSLTDFDIYALADLGNLRFVGLDNYIGLLQSPLFWKSLGNTLYFVVVGVVVPSRCQTAHSRTNFRRQGTGRHGRPQIIPGRRLCRCY